MRKLIWMLALLSSLTTYGQTTGSTQPTTQQIVYINGTKYRLHSVLSGETLSSIARQYDVSVELLRKANPALAADTLYPEQVIKIPVSGDEKPNKVRNSKEEKRLKRTFEKHLVASGETLYAISRRYHISVEVIMEDNPEVDPQHLPIGQELLIRKTEIGRTDDATAQSEMEEYEQRLNEATLGEGYIYHVVQPKETIYSLSRHYGITEEELIALNNLEAGLKAGAILRIPDPSTQTTVVENDEKDRIVIDTLATIQPTDVVFHALRPSETLHTALLLPMTIDGRPNRNFMAFYQGFLMGMEEIKRLGYTVELDLFDTQKSLARVEAILQEERFLAADLIIGPVYADAIDPILRHAEQRAIPVVTPLADLSQFNSDILFQMAPTDAHKYDKLKPLLDQGATITLIRTESVDREFEAEILAQLQGYSYQYYDYASVQGVEHAERSDLTPLLQQAEKHLFFVLPDNEIDVDRVLASLASAQTNLEARSIQRSDYMVVGSNRWNRYNNIDRTTFFKNRVVLFSLLHAKRDSEVIKDFDSQYIRTFGTTPSLYSYRGYETAIIFCRGMYSDIEYDMEGRRYRPLQTTYTFQQEEGSFTHINQEWVRVTYNPDFTISLE